MISSPSTSQLKTLLAVTGAEAVAASTITFLASAILSAYLTDWCGLRIAPAPTLVVALGAAAGAYLWLRQRRSALSGGGLVFAAIVAGTFAALLWLARPALLPTGSGPDLVHHLALIEYIQEHWRLVHDVGLSEYLGEMIDYTPGLHLLVALTAAWLPGDALHLTYPVVAFTVALKAGFVFLIARRLLPRGILREPFAVVAVVLLLVPRVYSIGSFTEQSYLAQVASELFAVAAWWAIVIWDEDPSRAAMAAFALFAAAAFLVWPVWTGPLLIVLAAVALAHTEVSPGERARQIVPALASVAAIAAMHASGHAGGFRIAGTGGFAIAPTASVVGWPFFAVSAIAVAASAFRARTRVIALLVAAIAVQALGLYLAARSSGARSPYLAIKMFYLAIYPMAIAVAVLVAEVWSELARRSARLRSPAAAWTLAAVVAVVAARPLLAAPRPRPVVTEPVLEAAMWARQHASTDCIDYLTRDGYTAYWVHLAVFGNPRASGRATNDDTFEPKRALVRWILPGGLPYAITDDLSALPRDVRDNVDVLARFGPAAVVKRRGESRCP